MLETLPDPFVQRMQTLLATEAPAFFAALERSPQTGLRTNLIKLRSDHLAQIAPFDLQPVPWCPSGFFVGAGARPGKHPYHAAGLFYVQEPSAMAVVEALDVQPGMRVLDLAAAPGGKTTQIAALLGGEGVLVANEVEGSRIKPLGENLERWGTRNVVITQESPERIADQLGPIFDRVLLDAPCSGEGMFRKNAAAQAEWSVDHVLGCAVRQDSILDQAVRLVKPGGLLVYSTCTFAPEENEQRIAAVLAKHPDWELVDLPKQHGFAPARPDWAPGAPAELARAVRLWPHKLQGEGHFIALLRNTRSGAVPLPNLAPSVRHAPRKERSLARTDSITPALGAWHEFEQSTLTTTLPADRLRAINDQVYLLPSDLPDLNGLRVVRTGLWLGTSKPGRFEPSHALALAVRADEARSIVDVQADAAERYLRGETINASGSNGWVLVTIDGWPLGWGRRVGDVVKNFYPKGLRRMG